MQKRIQFVMAMRKDEQIRGDNPDADKNNNNRKRKAESNTNVVAAGTDNKKSRRSLYDNNSNNESDECGICGKSNHSTDKCYYLKGCRDMVAQQRSQRQQQYNNANPNGYQPQYQSNYGYCATPQPLTPGRQVMFGNNSMNNYSTDLNYGYNINRGNFARPFNQS